MVCQQRWREDAYWGTADAGAEPTKRIHMRGTCALSLLVNPHIVLCVSPAHSEAS